MQFVKFIDKHAINNPLIKLSLTIIGRRFYNDDDELVILNHKMYIDSLSSLFLSISKINFNNIKDFTIDIDFRTKEIKNQMAETIQYK